uniref:G-protein coupled receptors family 1 profile domain-containing protein n=1 Tax=Pseudonaja textilis TaxID=8673 RepID=A0A670ZDR3_PSETE
LLFILIPVNLSTCARVSGPAVGASAANMEAETWNQSEPNSTQLFCGGPNGTLGGRRGSSCSGISPSMITAIVIMALYSVVCVVGLFGNFLVMYVIIR